MPATPPLLKPRPSRHPASASRHCTASRRMLQPPPPRSVLRGGPPWSDREEDKATRLDRHANAMRPPAPSTWRLRPRSPRRPPRALGALGGRTAARGRRPPPTRSRCRGCPMSCRRWPAGGAGRPYTAAKGCGLRWAARRGHNMSAGALLGGELSPGRHRPPSAAQPAGRSTGTWSPPPCRRRRRRQQHVDGQRQFTMIAERRGRRAGLSRPASATWRTECAESRPSRVSVPISSAVPVSRRRRRRPLNPRFRRAMHGDIAGAVSLSGRTRLERPRSRG